ncbi:type II toxin-antitoxin system RelE/ParE family toxin [Niabella hibiscisoli]|uniref:type II toxin-antitoxin system RelE/ParE family toxin n=1 Tax=Niabella hibiscisoli TaxID=1825928 RepID=UPI001F0F709D|nr:type II toxin-antitoxin system RelE/ParE family toxin [Niabella hibiscisoli]MCH5716519.1 type II toxin-antitoxin system RelE/ParE family toxin [Niabella hibiscisoli]
MATLKVIIDIEASNAIKQAFIYIRKNSLQNAEKVKADIFSCIKQLSDNPHRHAADKYRLNNDPAFRAFEIHKFRITYHVSINEIRVIRIRHTQMNPLFY